MTYTVIFITSPSSPKFKSRPKMYFLFRTYGQFLYITFYFIAIVEATYTYL